MNRRLFAGILITAVATSCAEMSIGIGHRSVTFFDYYTCGSQPFDGTVCDQGSGSVDNVRANEVHASIEFHSPVVSATYILRDGITNDFVTNLRNIDNIGRRSILRSSNLSLSYNRQYKIDYSVILSSGAGQENINGAIVFKTEAQPYSVTFRDILLKDINGVYTLSAIVRNNTSDTILSSNVKLSVVCREKFGSMRDAILFEKAIGFTAFEEKGVNFDLIEESYTGDIEAVFCEGGGYAEDGRRLVIVK